MVIGIDASRANIKERTGTEWYSWHIIRQLIPYFPEHTIRLYLREPFVNDLIDLQGRVDVRILPWPPGILWSHLRLSWELLWHPPDVLFVPADTIPIIHPKNTVTTIHDIAFERLPAAYSPTSVQRRMGWLRWLVTILVRIGTLGRYGPSERDYHRWSVRHALRSSRHILSVSEFTKHELVDSLKADPDRITVTHQGVIQPEDIKGLFIRSNNNTDIPLLQNPYFLYHGRLEMKKNLVNLFRGFEICYRSHPEAKLVLIGNPGYGWSEQQAWLQRHANVSQAISILPWQPPETLWQYIRQAVAYVFVSSYEGFGRPPLEAYSAGTPVIAAKTTSLPEVLGDCPLYVNHNDPNDIAQALVFALEHPNEFRKQISCGQHRARQFTWEKATRITAQVIKKLMT